MIAIRKYIETLFYYAKGDFVMKLPNYYEDPNTLHVGTCENRSYYIPCGQDQNSHATLLSGDWRLDRKSVV